MIRLLLASASPARLATLRQAGIEPTVLIADLDEEAILDEARAKAGELGVPLEPEDAVLALAQAKAFAVADRLAETPEDDRPDLLVAADSMLEFAGEIVGKPGTADVATRRWQAMRGKTGVLHTGHWLMDVRDDDHGGTGATVGATASTLVRFAELSDAEIDAYVATGEPLRVAGGFTVDGLGGPFVTAIEGDYHNVVGISLPVVRELVAAVGIAWPALWATTAG